MNGEVVNLRKARKARQKVAKETEAAANRARFGRTKEERARDLDRKERLQRLLDGARRGSEDGGGHEDDGR